MIRTFQHTSNSTYQLQFSKDHVTLVNLKRHYINRKLWVTLVSACCYNASSGINVDTEIKYCSQGQCKLKFCASSFSTTDTEPPAGFREHTSLDISRPERITQAQVWKVEIEPLSFTKNVYLCVMCSFILCIKCDKYANTFTTNQVAPVCKVSCVVVCVCVWMAHCEALPVVCHVTLD